MAEVKVGENESIESALRRFKKKFKKPVFYLKLKNVKDMKNLALKENTNLKLLVREKCKILQ